MYHVVNKSDSHPYVHHVATISEAQRIAAAERTEVGGPVAILTDPEWDMLPNRSRYWRAA